MKNATSLSNEEKQVIKALLERGKRSQDIHALINYERSVTINFGRIAGIKNNNNIAAASSDDVEFFIRKKKSFDPITGLKLYDDERLIRSREAMILAVVIFNSPSYRFKTEIFSVLANIAWTYLLHEYYERKGISPLNKDGTSFALSFMLSRSDCPLSKGAKNNLLSIKSIRDDVEHKLLGRSDLKWLSLFQACCLNFDKAIVSWFGPKVTLQNDLSIALQFGRLDFEHAAQLQTYDIPPHIDSLDALLTKNMTQEELDDIEYQFKVVYTLDSASKGKSHIQFLHPESEEGKSVQNILQKFKIADDLYPHKPGDVVRAVRKKSRKAFTMSDHTAAWKRHNVRPGSEAKDPEKTNREFCIYHPAHRDYTYNDKWINVLVEELGAHDPASPIVPEAKSA